MLTVATTAGIMGLKKTFEIIPMCHILQLSHAGIEWNMTEDSGKYEIHCICTVKCNGKTGVEITVRDIYVSAGAGFIVALTGSIMTMPGLSKAPAAYGIDVDDDGNIIGLF